MSLFISFEGPDGSGKTTQIRLLAEWLRADGHTVVLTREPGGTPIGDQIRAVLHDPLNTAMVARAEILLYSASRAQHVAQRIRPALAAGKIVISDRYADSTIAYQGYGRGLNLDDVHRVNSIATDGLKPDITFFLDVSLTVSNDRTKHAESDRIESSGNEFFEKVRNGFLEIARKEPERVIVINSEAKIETTLQKIVNILQSKEPDLFTIVKFLIEFMIFGIGYRLGYKVFQKRGTY